MLTVAKDLTEFIVTDVKSSPYFQEAMLQFEPQRSSGDFRWTDPESGFDEATLKKCRRKAEQTYFKTHLDEQGRKQYATLIDDLGYLRRTERRLLDIGYAMRTLSDTIGLDAGGSRPPQAGSITLPEQDDSTTKLRLAELGVGFTHILDEVSGQEEFGDEQHKRLAARLARLLESEGTTLGGPDTQARRYSAQTSEHDPARGVVSEGEAAEKVSASDNLYWTLNMTPLSATAAFRRASSIGTLLSVARCAELTDGQGIVRTARDVADRLAARALRDVLGDGR